MPAINGLTFIGNESPNKIYIQTCIYVYIYMYTCVYIYTKFFSLLVAHNFFDYSFWMISWCVEVWGRSRLIYQNGFAFFLEPHTVTQNHYWRSHRWQLGAELVTPIFLCLYRGGPQLNRVRPLCGWTARAGLRAQCVRMQSQLLRCIVFENGVISERVYIQRRPTCSTVINYVSLATHTTYVFFRIRTATARTVTSVFRQQSTTETIVIDSASSSFMYPFVNFSTFVAHCQTWNVLVLCVYWFLFIGLRNPQG